MPCGPENRMVSSQESGPYKAMVSCGGSGPGSSEGIKRRERAKMPEGAIFAGRAMMNDGFKRYERAILNGPFGLRVSMGGSGPVIR